MKRDEALQCLGFDCWCPSCNNKPPSRISKERRQKIEDVREALNIYEGLASEDDGAPDTAVPRHPRMALDMAERAITLMLDENLLGMSLAKIHRQASKYSLQLGDIGKAGSHAKQEVEIEKICLGSETQHLNDKAISASGGNAAAWAKEVERVAEREQVKFRLCEKREAKDRKKADKKAQKKAEKKGKRYVGEQEVV